MYWAVFALALLPAALHWWWTRGVAEPSAAAVLPERHLAIAQRVSFVTSLCTVTIILGARWDAAWILPVQFVALTATSYRARRAMFGETWPFHRYLSWRLRLHVGMFGLWWFVALAPVVVTQANPPTTWWLSGLAAVIAVAWHHWGGRVLLVLLRASRLERPDLDGHFQRVFASAREPAPELWRAGEDGGRLANAFALVTLGQRGVLFFDSLLEHLPADEITAILAHEVAHLEQFNRQRLLGMYSVTTVLILMLMIGSAVAGVFVPALESWIWIASVVGVFGAMWLRARRMQAHETDADLRAIELCGDADALIRGLIRIYEINHIPRRWSATAETHATHPSLARRIRTIRARTAAPDAQPETIERVIIASSEPGRYAVIDHHRVGFLWMDADSVDPATILDRADRVEMVAYDQLSELRVSARRGTIELTAVDHRAKRWSMPIQSADAARVQAALDRVDHLVIAPPPRQVLGIKERVAVFLVILLAAPYNAIGAVLVPALLALRRPKRSLMFALAAALAVTAIASVNEVEVTVVRITLLGILTIAVLWSARGPRDQETTPDAPLWTWIERFGLLLPVLVGLVFAVANARDLFGLHSAIRDRGWFTAALAAMAVFYVVQTGQRTARRAGLGVAVVATVSLVIGSPWFLVHAVADPLIADMPPFEEKPVPVIALATRSFKAGFSSVRVTPDGAQFVLVRDYQETAEYEDNAEGVPQPIPFIAGAFDGWHREIRAFDVAVIDDVRLLVLDREHGSSRLHAEDMRSGRSLWTITLPDVDVSTVQASPDGRWRAFTQRGRVFVRLDGRIGSSTFTSTRWTVATDTQSYVDTPRNDGGSGALALASLWQEPSLPSLLADWRETKTLLRVDGTTTTEIVTSHLNVECTTPPIGVTGSVCVSSDGRSSRLWRVDLSSGALNPLGEARQTLWRPSQPSQQRLAGIANGRPVLALLDAHTLVSLVATRRCWAMDVDVSRDIVVAVCPEGDATAVSQYRLPAGSY
jgi:Zn-dependent protease with chaperone function